MDIAPIVKMGKTEAAGYSGFGPGALKDRESRGSTCLQAQAAFTHQVPLPSQKGGPLTLSQE